MASEPLPEVIGVEAVMRRYGIRDRRVARRVMDEAGTFLIGRRLVVRLDDLDAYERRLRRARGGPSIEARRGVRTQRTPRREIRPGWWRDGEAGPDD